MSPDAIVQARRNSASIAICFPTDPAGHVPSGIDSFIRGILRWAPEDLHYTLFGGTTDPLARPIGREVSVLLGDRTVRFRPIVRVDQGGRRGAVPLIVRYTWALREYARRGCIAKFDILDFHRIEPVWLFRRDSRPKNVVLHADYVVLRDTKADIRWRYWPWLYERVERSLFHSMDRIFTVRRTAVERYTKAYPTLANKFLFLPTWVESSVFHPAANAGERERLRTRLLRELGIRGTPQLLVFVGRLDHQKDPLLLMDAFRQAVDRGKDLHLIMIGDGVLRGQVEATSKNDSFRGRVSLLGTRSAAEIADVLRACDLFVLSSAYEGMPIAVLESLAAGLPVASTDVGELRLVVRDGINGQISRDRSPSGLANAICTALDKIHAIRGVPCQTAVAPYDSRAVLGRIYENHRRQGNIA